MERTWRDEPIEIVDYDDQWPRRFEDERALIEATIGRYVVGGLAHVGSTAVPGLAAKPVIDILAGVRSLDESRACIEPLERIGYMWAPWRVNEMHWFCKPHPGHRTHHLHLVPCQSPRFRDELAFRDRLHADAALAGDYVALKRELARRFRDDRDAYTEAKAEFVRAALLRPARPAASNPPPRPSSPGRSARA